MDSDENKVNTFKYHYIRPIDSKIYVNPYLPFQPQLSYMKIGNWKNHPPMSIEIKHAYLYLASLSKQVDFVSADSAIIEGYSRGKFGADISVTLIDGSMNATVYIFITREDVDDYLNAKS